VGFAVSVLPYLRRALPTIVFSLLNVVCGEIRTLVEAVQDSDLPAGWSPRASAAASLTTSPGDSPPGGASRRLAAGVGSASAPRTPGAGLTAADAAGTAAAAAELLSSATPHRHHMAHTQGGASAGSASGGQRLVGRVFNSSGVLTQDISLLLEGLKRVIHFCLLRPGEGLGSLQAIFADSDASSVTAAAPAPSSQGVFASITSVFSSSSGSSTPVKAKPQQSTTETQAWLSP
jgi:hypothetical protein